MKKILLVGASKISNLNMLKNYCTDDYLKVAIDGGYNYFSALNLIPDILVGDFDTIAKNQKIKAKQIITLNPIKDDTDTFYIIKKLLDDGYDEFHIFGCLGSKTDHTIANLQILRFLSKRNVSAYLYIDGMVLFAIQKSILHFSEKANGIISIFALSDESLFSLDGLKYNVVNHLFSNSIPLGISNEFILSKATIKVDSGSVMIYTSSNNLKYLSIDKR